MTASHEETEVTWSILRRAGVKDEAEKHPDFMWEQKTRNPEKHRKKVWNYNPPPD